MRCEPEARKQVFKGWGKRSRLDVWSLEVVIWRHSCRANADATLRALQMSKVKPRPPPAIGARGRPLTRRHRFEGDICLRGSRDRIVPSNQRRLQNLKGYLWIRGRPGTRARPALHLQLNQPVLTFSPSLHSGPLLSVKD